MAVCARRLLAPGVFRTPTILRMPEPPNWKAEYPFASHRLDLGTYRLHYTDEGPTPSIDEGPTPSVDEGTGPPILAVHGNPTWSFYWRALVARFRPTHRVVAPDHLGMGLSDKPQGIEVSIAQHRDNLLALVERLDLREITLVAHDWGGAIGLAAATAAPERFARIALLNTGAFPPPFVPLRIRACRFPILGSWAMRRLNLFAVAATRMAVERRESLSPVARAGLLAPYATPADREGIANFVKAIPFTKGHPSYRLLEDLERDLPKLSDKPVALIWGMRDWCFTPECLARFQAIWPHAETRELTDVGHYVMEEGRDATLDFLADFLNRHPRPGERPSPTEARAT